MSQRSLIATVGGVSSLIALVCRLAGVFRGSDLALFRFLGQPSSTPGLPLWIEVPCVVLFAFGMTFIAFGVLSEKARAGLFAAALLQPISAVAVGAVIGLPVSPFAWLTALVLPFLAGVGYRYFQRTKSERDLHTVFSNHLSALTLAKLGNLPEPVQPGKSTASVLHAVLASPAPGEFDAVVERLRETGAWVETQSGNRLVAVWNVPWPMPSSPQTATAATLPLAGKWQVGLATGELTSELSAAGAWQMHGPAFEKAAALCHANTVFGSRILLDLATADAVAETILLRPVDLFKEPGMDVGQEVYEPLALRHSASPTVVAGRDEFWNAVILFRQRRFSEALEAFRKLESDPVAVHYRERLEKLNNPS